MKKSLLTSILAFILLLPHAVLAEAPLVLGVPCYSNKECTIEELERILTEAFRRIGSTVKFKYLPPKRVMYEVQYNRVDGAALISVKDAVQIPGLAVADFPVSTAALVAFSAYQGREITRWEDLAGYRVGTVLGTTLLSDEMFNRSGIKRHQFKDAKLAFSMLRDKRLDYILGGATAGALMAKSIGLKVRISPPLFSRDLFTALSEKHADLAPQIARALKEMWEDGTTRSLLGKYESMMPDAEAK